MQNISLETNSLAQGLSEQLPNLNISEASCQSWHNACLHNPQQAENSSSLLYPGNGTEEFPSFPLYMRVVYSSLCSTTFLVGMVGNLLVPAVVYKDRELTNSSTGAFIVNLALADILVLLVCNPSFIVELFSPPQIWVLPAPMCKIVPFIELIVENASVLTILALSVERHQVICQPLRAARACTKKRAAVICALVWPVAALVSSPVVAWTELTMVKYLSPQAVVPACFARVDHLWPSIYMLSMNVGFFFVPLVILVALYFRIVKQLVLDDQHLVSHKKNSNFQARKQVIIMLGTVVLCFFVCLLPHHVFSLWHFFTSDIYSISSEMYFNLIFFSRTLIYVNSAANPVLYNLTSSRFRDSLSRLLGFKRKQKVISRTSSTHPGITTQFGLSHHPRSVRHGSPASGLSSHNNSCRSFKVDPESTSPWGRASPSPSPRSSQGEPTNKPFSPATKKNVKVVSKACAKQSHLFGPSWTNTTNSLYIPEESEMLSIPLYGSNQLTFVGIDDGNDEESCV